MLAGLLAWWRGLRHLEHRGYIYIWGNFWWFLLSLPIITAPAAWAGLMHLGYAAHHSPGVNLEAFWEGFRANFRSSLALVALNILVVGVNLVNLWGTQGQNGWLIDLLRGLWLLVLAIWFTVQFYLWPVFYAMEHPTLWGAMRNAGVMIMLNPLFTFSLWIGIALILIVSTVFFVPWVLLTGGTLAAVANSAVMDRLAAAGYPAESGL
jgi:uncharacterized membrane protein YesL